MGRFKWGHSFLSLNEGLLDQYAACDTAADVIRVQNEYLQYLAEETTHRGRGNDVRDGDDGGGDDVGNDYLKSCDLPPSNSSSEDDDYSSEPGEGEEELRGTVDKLHLDDDDDDEMQNRIPPL